MKMLALIVATVSVASTIGCRALDRERYYAIVDGARGDGGQGRDGAADGDSSACETVSRDAMAGDGACDPASVPQRSPGLRDLDGGVAVLVFVARRVQIGFASRSLWGQHGFDRDGLCSDPLRPTGMRACRPPDMLIPEVEDGERGRDNAIASRLAQVFTASGFDEASANTDIESGRGSLAARISFFGGANDGHVRVEWLPVLHGHSESAPAMPPRWDGTDIWHADATLAYDLTDPTLARVRSDAAFTSCGILVAPIPARLPLAFNAGPRSVRLTLSGGVFVGPLAQNGSSLGPTEFSGWWPVSDALNDLSTFGLCPPPPVERERTWDIARRALLAAADLIATGGTAPDVPCDAVSFGFGSEWVRARLGSDERSTPLPSNACDAGGP